MSNKLSPVVKSKAVMIATAISVGSLAYKAVDAAGNAEFLLQKLGLDEDAAKFLGSSRGIDFVVAISFIALVVSLLYQVNRATLHLKGTLPLENIQWHETAAYDLTAVTEARPALTPQPEVKQVTEGEPAPAKSEPNFVCMGTDILLTHLRDGVYVEGHHEPSAYVQSNALAAVVKVRNKFDPTRKVGKAKDVSAEIIYKRPDGYTAEVNRGGWLGQGNWVNFDVNDIRELIVAIVDRPGKGVFVLVKDYTHSSEDIPHIMAELQNDFYNTEVRLISEASGVLHETYNFSLEIIREPELNVVLEEIKELKPKEIRQRLEDFLHEGSEYLRVFPRDKQATSKEIAIVDEWEQRIVRFISRYPDLFSTALFLADYPEVSVSGGAQGGNWPSLKKLSRRLATLRQFIDELRRS